MEQQFLSLAKAEKHIGKSRSTLRRFVDSITKIENHPDRQFIKPTPTEVTEFHKNNHPFSWTVSIQLLDREFKKEPEPSPTPTANDGSSSAIELLQQTIGMLKHELDEKNRQIAQFQERDRETNILLQRTTEKLVMLTEGQKERSQSASDAVTVTTEGEQGSEAKKKGKPTLWERLHRPLF